MTDPASLHFMLDKVIDKLSRPLPSDELLHGWTEESRRAMSEFFSDLKFRISNNEVLPYFGILRGLDHWGVKGGELFLSVAEIDEKLRALERQQNQ